MAILRIHDGTSTFTYDETQILETQLSVAQQESDGTIEYQSVDVSFSGTLFGVDSFFDLPDEGEGYRAQLEMPFATVNGVVRLDTIRQGPVDGIWHLTIITGAVDILFDRLEAQVMLEGISPLSSVFVIVKEIASDTGVSSDVQYTWYDIYDAWEETTDAILNVDVQNQPIRSVDFTLDVMYDDASVIKTIERNPLLYVADPASPDLSNPYMPAWTAKDIYDVLRQLLAWRINVQWASFPSDTIIMEILTDRFLLGAGLPNLGGSELDPYEIGFERADLLDYGLAYTNQPAKEPFLHANASLLESDTYYAADVVRLDGEGVPKNADIQTIDLQLPQRWNDIATDVDVVPFPATHPNYKEDITYASPVILGRAVEEAGKVFMGAFYDPGAGRRLVISRVPKDPAPTQSSPVGEHFATNLSLNYQMLRTGKTILEGSFNRGTISAEPVVGDPQKGVRFLGTNDWFVRRKTLNMVDGAMQLQLAIHDAFTQQAAVGAPPAASPPEGFICVCIFKAAVFYDAILDWQAPTNGAQGPPVSYDIYRKLIGFDPAPVFLVNTTNTAYVDAGIVAGTYEYSVQSVNGFGKSTFVYCTTQCGP